jgi:hypothetical protein
MDIFLMVVAIGICVLGAVFAGLYCLDRAVEQNEH